jgi:hypothetical protein
MTLPSSYRSFLSAFGIILKKVRRPLPYWLHAYSVKKTCRRWLEWKSAISLIQSFLPQNRNKRNGTYHQQIQMILKTKRRTRMQSDPNAIFGQNGDSNRHIQNTYAGRKKHI